MIPNLTIDIDSIHENWKEHPETWGDVEELCAQIKICNGTIPAFQCGEEWIKLGCFKEFKGVDRKCKENDYGYCDSEEALAKYLQKYIDSPDNFFVEVGLLDMEYEKFYKFGSYINADGVDTGNDYDWDSDAVQQYPGFWIRFNVTKLTEK